MSEKTYVEKAEYWADAIKDGIIDLAVHLQDARTHVGLCNAILLGFLDNGKKEFFVPAKVIEQANQEKHSVSIECHGTDEKGMVKYTVEIKK